MKRLSSFQSALARLAATATSRAGGSNSLLLLTYHRVLPAPDPLLPGEPDAAEFSDHLDLLARTFNVVGLREALERLGSGSLPPRAVCITFDDGYANNCDVALPMLRDRGLPAAVFVATGYIGRGRMFNDTVIEAIRRAGPALDLTALGLGRFELTDDSSRRRAIEQILPAIKHMDPVARSARAERIAVAVGAELPDDLMMSEAQVRRMSDLGIEVGAHTVNHPILKSVSSETARVEIADSRQALREITGREVAFFAYPNGRPNLDYDASHVEMVRAAGFEAAVSTAPGAASRAADRYQLPRVALWGTSALKGALRLAASYRDREYPRAAA